MPAYGRVETRVFTLKIGGSPAKRAKVGGQKRRGFRSVMSPGIFARPPQFLASSCPAEARAPSEARGEGETNRLWWCLLEKVRTFYQQNPDVD